MFEVCLPLPLHPTPHLSSHPWPQILTGTVPFPDESDEEIVDKVTRGLRPERPSSNPSQGMTDELWEQTVACWNRGPNERPTAPKVLRALGEIKHREPAASMEASDDEMMREWDLVEDAPGQRAFFIYRGSPKPDICLVGF